MCHKKTIHEAKLYNIYKLFKNSCIFLKHFIILYKLFQFVREIGYCPQFDAILDELTGEETLNLLAGLRGVPRFQRKAMMKDFIELVDLTECYKRQTRTYSGGNKRKLSTAMALVGAPALVFLDEPTTGKLQINEPISGKLQSANSLDKVTLHVRTKIYILSMRIMQGQFFLSFSY